MYPYETKWPLEDPWVAKSGQGTPQGGPKGEPNGRNGCQEGALGEPKWLQERPWGRQDAPKMTQDDPKESQEDQNGTRWTPRTSKTKGR